MFLAHRFRRSVSVVVRAMWRVVFPPVNCRVLGERAGAIEMAARRSSKAFSSEGVPRRRFYLRGILESVFFQDLLPGLGRRLCDRFIFAVLLFQCSPVSPGRHCRTEFHEGVLSGFCGLLRFVTVSSLLALLYLNISMFQPASRDRNCRMEFLEGVLSGLRRRLLFLTVSSSCCPCPS